MKKNNINPKLYPHPNPEVPGSSSRFAVSIEKMKVDGQTVKKDKLAAAEPELPICDFQQDQHTGEWKFVSQKNEKGEPLTRKGLINPYIPSQELIELVRLAQILQRPILIKGEPGSGKTQLARSVAYEWYGKDYKQHFFEWQIKSTSKAVDGLYTFDHLARLYDAQLNRNEPDSSGVTDMKKYRKFGPMGKAFLTSTAENPSILLIDEIDKAEIDFPNDLLLELDEGRFTIPASETGETIEAGYPPLIFITSNDEREMPEAFLRRCLFMYVKFPEDTLVDIIRAHMPGLVEDYPDFVTAAIKRFLKLRGDIEKDPADNKRVSTSELLDWLHAFHYDLSSGTKSVQDLQLDQLPLYHHAILKTYAALNREQPATANTSLT